MDSSQPSANNAPYAVVYNLNEEEKIEYCYSVEHAQAIALQGMAIGWQEITIVDLNSVKR